MFAKSAPSSMGQRMRCLSILTSLFLGICIGISITCLANSWWVREPTTKLHIGLWQFCASEGGDCQRTWEVPTIKDSEFFLATIGAWLGGCVFVVLADVLWVVYTCRGYRSRGTLISSCMLTFLAFGCFLATILIWWLKLLEDDAAFGLIRDLLEFHWVYWVAVGTTGATLIAFILLLTGVCLYGGTEV